MITYKFRTLGYIADGRGFKYEVGQPMTGKISLSIKMVIITDFGKDKNEHNMLKI